MSGSTVSATANPRRRPSAITGLNQTIEILNNTTISSKTDKIVAVNNDGKLTRDPINSIKGDLVVDRSKAKKSLQFPNSNDPIRTRNNRKGSQKQPKPRWLTVMSVLTKNLLLLVVLVGLVQMVRKLVVNSNSGSLIGFTDMEGRIAGLESRCKASLKKLEVEVEVVEKKLGSEIGNLRGEIDRRIEDGNGEIEERLEGLKEKSESLERGLTEVRSKALTKDEFFRLYDEFKKGEKGDFGGLGLSFDKIRGLAREIVEEEMEKHVADGVGMVDFALGSGGAVVVDHSEPLGGGKFGRWLGGNMKNRVHNDAVKMLMPSFGEPGNCFPLKGSSGFVVIRLRTAIVPEAVTLEHVAKSVAYDRSSAPKHCRVSGFLSREQGLETQSLDNVKTFVLTDFIYDLEKSNAQTFYVFEQSRFVVINTILLEFSSNHGSSTHTCIYRFRVHGHEPESVRAVPTDS